MSVIGIGLDLCPVARMEQAVGRHGERFVARIFTASESAYCWSRGERPWESFAARFAAKEAASKALGAPRGIGWHDVEVVPARPGEHGPQVILRGRAREVAEARGVRAVLLSITHADGMAAAMAVAVGGVTMGKAPVELWTADTAAAADQYTMAQLGVPSPILMERAALCVAHEVAARRDGLVVAIACGPGNNGGDGLAVARQLHGWEIPTMVWAFGAGNSAVAEQLAMARSYGVTIRAAGDAWPERALWVDALLGTGSRGAPRGAIADVLIRWPRDRGPVIAVDVPTGVDPDTGAVHPTAIVADVTVTFARSKPGLHVTPGRAHAGRVIVADMGLRGVPDRSRLHALVDPELVARVVAARGPAEHKGQRGHVAVVGGTGGTPGAAILAGVAALRGGAGLATICSDDATVVGAIVAQRPELMVRPWAVPPVREAQALVVGPGLATDDARARAGALWHDTRPAVWDAGAIDVIPDGAPAGPRVLTPHPGEAARLWARWFDPKTTAASAQARRLEIAEGLARRSGAVVVLKGEGSIVATPDGRVAIAVSGAATLATAGSGDCLAGLIGALLAAGVPAESAACVGVHVHGVAGELLPTGATASDLVDVLPAAIAAAGAPDHPGIPRIVRG